MPETITNRLKNAWNAFMSRDPPEILDYNYTNVGPSSYYRPDKIRSRFGNDRTIVTSIYNRVAVDCASVSIEHVKFDDNGKYLETVDSGLNNCLTLEANKDQTGRAFIQDVVQSMLTEGVVAIVPVDTTVSIYDTTSWDILSMRTGRVLTWYPNYVQLEVYDDNAGYKKQIMMPKSSVCLIENPLYSIINEPNSIMQRLIRKLALLDAIDEQSGAGKLDLIIQLPYIIKGEMKTKQAEERKKSIERQLSDSKYGIAYTDATEHITQLNRPLDNNLMNQIDYLTQMLYSQLGITKEIMEGTASEQVMLNYNNRTIEPIVSAITDEMKRKFLTKTARTRNHSIMFFKDPFRLVPVSQMADIADKFTRNEILSSNEVRQIVGYKRVNDSKADELSNKNLNRTEGQEFATVVSPEQQDHTNTQQMAEEAVNKLTRA